MISEKLYSPRWTRWIVLALRLIVGAVFAFSGFVKAVDPWGVIYKFNDYVNVLGCDWLSPFVPFCAFSLSIIEFVLGVCLIIGAYRRFSVWLSFILMLVMTPLTLWLAVTNAVPECGCFGEAVHLSNVATFVKNVVLLLAIVYLLRFNVRVMNLYSSSIQWIVTLATTVFVTLVAMYGYFYQPMIDFRQYKVGENILGGLEDNNNQMEELLFVYEKDGVRYEFPIDSLPDDEDTTWVYVDRKEPLSSKQYDSGLEIVDNDGFSITYEVVQAEGEQVLLVFPDMSEVDITYTYLINLIDDLVRKQNADIIGVASATNEEIAEWNDLSMATYPIYRAEDVELKILARGNPAVVYLKDGRIVWKRTLYSISAVRVDKAINGEGNLAWIAEDYDGKMLLKMMSLIYMLFMVGVLILNRSYRVIKFSSRLIKKNQK